MSTSYASSQERQLAIGAPHYSLRHAVHPARFLAELAAIEQKRRAAFIASNVLHQQIHDGRHRPGIIAVTSTHRVPRGTPVPPGYREIEFSDEFGA